MLYTESRAATAIQAAARGRRARSEFIWKQSHALGWVRHLQHNDDDSSNPLSEAIDVDYVQSEALLELERKSKKLAKQQAHFADQLRALENLPAVVDKRLLKPTCHSGVTKLLTGTSARIAVCASDDADTRVV